MNDLQTQWITGQLSYGDKLASVEDLATRYGVGRSTIREALSALKVLGMVTIKQGGGTTVNAYEPTAQQVLGLSNHQSMTERIDTLRHTLEVRRVLETGCASLAASHHNADDIAMLKNILVDMHTHLDQETQSEQTDIKFHLYIAKATHNPILIELMESLSQKLHDSMRDSRALWFYAERSSAERLYLEHQDIFLAIEQHNPEQAAMRMDAHLAKVDDVLREKTRKLP